MMLATVLLFAAEVSAQGVQGPRRERFGGPPPQRMMPDARPTQFNADGDTAQQRQRMTPEERRQLRRDVHDAGRDLYPERRRERRREMEIRRGE